MKKLILIVIMVVPFLLQSQTPFYIGGKISQGIIAPHHADMRYFINKPVNGFSLLFGFQTTGKQDWQNHWGFPELGFGTHYVDFKNPDVLGNSKVIFLYIDAPFLESKILSFNYNIGFGIAYLNKIFNYQTNYTNIAIGSHLNVYANVNFELQLKAKKVVYFTDFGITHLSNGGTKMPNLGINVPTISVGFKYKTANFIRQKKILSNSWQKHTDVQVLLSASKHADKFSVSNKAKIISSLSVDYGVYLSEKSRVGGGVDFMFDENRKNISMNDSTIDNSSSYFGGIHFSYNVVFGRTQFTFQEIMLINSKSHKLKSYQRYGFRVIIADKWLIGATLLTNFFNAQAIEPAIGYRFH